MPIYEVQSPNGQTLEIEGDTMPTEEELNNIFAQVAPPPVESTLQQPTTEQPTTEPPVIDPVDNQQTINDTESVNFDTAEFIRSKVPGSGPVLDVLDQFSEGAIDTINDLGRLVGFSVPDRQNLPEGTIEQISRFAGSLASPNIPGVGPAIKGASLALKTPKMIAKAQQAKNLLEPIAKLTNKSVAFVGELLSSVPRDVLEKAISNPKLLNKSYEGPKTWRRIGNKIQNTLNFVKKKAGEQVKQETDALMGVTDLIDAEKYAGRIENLLDETIKGRIETLSGKGKKIVNKIENQLLDIATDPVMDGKITAQELHGVKKQIDNMVKWNSETVQQLGDVGESLLKKVRSEINEDLRSISSKYAKANDDFSKIADIQNSLGTRLKDKKLATNIKSIALQGDDYELSILKELDSIAPKSLKFVDDLDVARLNEPFSQLFPGRGGGSGSEQGAANFFRILSGIKTGGLTAPLSSPAIQKRLIQNYPKVGRAVQTAVRETAPAISIKSLSGRENK